MPNNASRTLTKEVIGQSRVDLRLVAVLGVSVFLAAGCGLPDDVLNASKLVKVDVAVAVQVEHAEGNLELTPGTRALLSSLYCLQVLVQYSK